MYHLKKVKNINTLNNIDKSIPCTSVLRVNLLKMNLHTHDTPVFLS